MNQNAANHVAESEPARITVLNATVITETGGNARSHAAVELSLNYGSPMFVEHGDYGIGPIDALCKAFEKIVPDFDWEDYQVRAESKGSNASVRATVLLRRDGGIFHGEGSHVNTLHASAAAIADALNKIRWHEWSKGKRL